MIGAAAGGFIGKFLASVGVMTVPHLFKSGFAAVTAAVVGAPISVVLVVFELTQSYDLICSNVGSSGCNIFPLFLGTHFLTSSYLTRY